MLSIVSCIYNKIDFVKRIIQAVEENTDVIYEYILILNSQEKEVRDYILGLKNKTVIIPPKNVGMNVGYNLGFAISKYSLVTKLDDDVVVPKGWASATIKAFNWLPKLAMCATNLDWGKPQEISGFSQFLTISTFDQLTIEEINDKTGFLGFHCVTFIKEIWEELGKFQGSRLYGGDEVFFYKKALEKGYRMVYLRDFMAIHLSKFKDETRRRWQMEVAYGQTDLDFEEWKKLGNF